MPLPAGSYPPLSRPVELTDLERCAQADERLRVVRREISKVARQLRAGAEVGAELDALMIAEDAAMSEVRAAAIQRNNSPHAVRSQEAAQ